MLKINLNEKITEIPSGKIGIDIGQSLSKLAYLKDEKLILSSFPTKTCIPVIKELLISMADKYNTFSFTGGRSFNLYKKYKEAFKTNLINEFEANVKGIEFLYRLEKNKELSRSLVVTIGTGTSIVLRNGTFQHLGGSALGGGFFMGLVKMVYDLNDYSQVMNLAKKGNRYNLDLKVSDIYSPEDKRVDLLFREFTAASLGKIDEIYNIKSLKKEDFINSIISLIGENLGTIASITADKNNATDIVFCGGFLKENRILKKILSLMCKVNQKKAIFLKNSEFCAAIGALII
jgi:type II pantothenate kinase